MRKFLYYSKRAYDFVVHDDSIWSWLVNLVLAFIIVKFIIYPTLALILGSSLPLVAVISGSMEHEGLGFDQWWEQNGYWYEERNITKEMFKEYKFKNGFNKGDVMVLMGADNIQIGDVLVYNSPSHNYPIIHRVTYINELDFVIKGDNNDIQDPSLVNQDQVIGRAVLRIPYIGWIKIWFTQILGI